MGEREKTEWSSERSRTEKQSTSVSLSTRSVQSVGSSLSATTLNANVQHAGGGGSELKIESKAG